MRSFGFITFSLLTFVVNSQVAVNDSDPFALYAYGEGLGGLPVFATGSKWRPLALKQIITATVRIADFSKFTFTPATSVL